MDHTTKNTFIFHSCLLRILPTIIKKNPIDVKMLALSKKTPIRKDATAMLYQNILIP